MSDEPGKKRSLRLPSSGLADEILAALREGRLDVETPEDAPAAPASEDAVADEVTDRGLDRIYTFTDGLQLGDEEETEQETYETWVELRLAGHPFALPVADVQEVLRVGELTPVPNAPFPVLGVFNLRGRVVPLMDLRARLGLPDPAPSAASRIVVVESRRRSVGLLVDSVERVTKLARSLVRPAGDEMPIAAVAGLYDAESGEMPLLAVEEILRLPEEESDGARGSD